MEGVICIKKSIPHFKKVILDIFHSWKTINVKNKISQASILVLNKDLIDPRILKNSLQY